MAQELKNALDFLLNYDSDVPITRQDAMDVAPKKDHQSAYMSHGEYVFACIDRDDGTYGLQGIHHPGDAQQTMIQDIIVSKNAIDLRGIVGVLNTERDNARIVYALANAYAITEVTSIRDTLIEHIRSCRQYKIYRSITGTRTDGR